MKYDPAITDVLNRNAIKDEIATILRNNDELPPNSVRNSIFVYGKSGVGKTTLVKHILHELDYDVLLYDAADIRNKSTIDQIMKASVCTNNVFHMLHHKSKKIVIVMDEIEGMNNGDRGGINALIRLIRPKQAKTGAAADAAASAFAAKSSKQQSPEMFHCNLICICNHNIDKKISEIMKLCSVIHVQPPTPSQMLAIAKMYTCSDELDSDSNEHETDECLRSIISHSHNDLRKFLLHIELIKRMMRRPRRAETNEVQPIVIVARNIFSNSFNVNVKNVIYKLIKSDTILNENEIFTSETNRTMIALIWHENIIDYIRTDDDVKFIAVYQKFLENMCIGDYIDRITFQKQIWQLNEMTSFIKVLYNQSLLKDSFDQSKISAAKLSDIRFTKVLTKYSSEYNNYIFLQTMCERFNVDRNDLISLIACAMYKHTHATSLVQELSCLKYKVSLIELKRLHKFINKVDYNSTKHKPGAVTASAAATLSKNKTPTTDVETSTTNAAQVVDGKVTTGMNENENENGAFILSDEEDEAYRNYQTFDDDVAVGGEGDTLGGLGGAALGGAALGGSAPQ